MSVKECVVCAWRATCNLKFQFESVETHCREFTRDITLSAEDDHGDVAQDAGDAEKKVKTAE